MARLAALLPRLAAIVIIGLLATSTITFAAANKRLSKSEADAPPLASGPQTLIVPDIRGQAHVFAKGILEDGGFAWRVEGSVKGYAANLVAVQLPAPGTRVLDTGSPTIVVRLQRNPAYEERGLPENVSPYKGTRLVVLGAKEKKDPPQPKPRAKDKKPPKKNEPPAPVAPAAPADSRKPDFQVPGAPPEPTDEMPLPDRARLLEKRVGGQAHPSTSLVNYWLFQHSWLVTGAKFGWHDGAEALRILVRVDQSMQSRWGIGAKSAAVARAALAEVESKSSK
jgi:hypothetical protein